MVAPLTPPECDLQDFPFMPLHVARLRDSDLANEESPEACWYALLLWAASWHQIPAASLPDNDKILTKLLGLGRDTATFAANKAAALRGFIKCDDGRLYHPVVAEQAINAWEGKLQQRWRTECARIKKANQRHGANDPLPTFEQFLSGDVLAPCPVDVPEDTADCPSGNSVQGKETGRGKGRLKKDPQKPPEGAFSPEFMKAWNAYPEEGRATTNQADSFAEWEPMAAEVGAGPLLACVRAFAASAAVIGPKAKAAPKFTTWLRRRRFETFLKLAGAVAEPGAWPGPRDLWDRIAKRMGEDWARSYLGRCEVDGKTLFTTSTTVERGLLSEVRAELAEAGFTVVVGKARAA